MARSILNGTITFGLVNVPVKLYTATENKTVRFREVHVDDGARSSIAGLPEGGRRVPYETSSRASRSPRASTSC